MNRFKLFTIIFKITVAVTVLLVMFVFQNTYSIYLYSLVLIVIFAFISHKLKINTFDNKLRNTFISILKYILLPLIFSLIVFGTILSFSHNQEFKSFLYGNFFIFVFIGMYIFGEIIDLINIVYIKNEVVK